MICFALLHSVTTGVRGTEGLTSDAYSRVAAFSIRSHEYEDSCISDNYEEAEVALNPDKRG